MKYSKKQIYHICFIFILLLAMAILTIFTQFPEATPLTLSVSNEAMYVFYTLFNGNRVMIFFFITLIIAISNTFSILYFKYFHQGFTSFINTRISYRTYLKRSIKKVFLFACGFYFILNLAILISIHLFYTPINFSLPQDTYILFAQNQIVNLLFYCICSSLGFGFYQVFLLSLIPLIKNEFLYRAISFLHFVVSLLGFMLIKPLFMPFYDHIGLYVNTLASIFVPLNLYTPGLFFEIHGFSSFFLTTMFYGIVTYCLFRLSYKKVMHSE